MKLDASGIKDIKNEFEAWIRTGRSQLVRAKLPHLDASAIPRSEFSHFANLARRAGVASWALRLLKPVIHPEERAPAGSAPATPQEIASYALALSATGALSEARKLANQIAAIESAETLLACAYVSIWSWEYSKAIAYFKRYLALPGLTEFQITLAELNLASSHEFVGHTAKAQTLVDKVLPLSKSMNWRLIERDALLLAAQLEIPRGNWPGAGALLAEALELSRDFNLDLLLVEKWQAILDLHASPTSARVVQALVNLKARSAEQHRWEILRDCDYHSAKVFNDAETLNRLYFGTPHESFRKRLVSESKNFWSPTKDYLWRPAGEESGLVIDVQTGSIEGAQDHALAPNLCLRLFQVLTLDLYRPFKTGSLHAELYPEKHFDVLNSSHTIANVISRLRGDLERLGWPIQVDCVNKLYRLNVSGPVGLRLKTIENRGLDETSEDKAYKENLTLLEKTWSYRAFSARQAGQALALSSEEIRKLMRQAVDDRILIPIGATSSRMYRFKTRSDKSA